MSHPYFSLLPAQSTVIYGNRGVPGIPMPELSGIRSVTWCPELNEGLVTHEFNPEEGQTKQEFFTDTTEYEVYLNLAKRTIFCHDNPKTFWSTVHPVGKTVEVKDLDWPQPENTHSEAPPESPSANSQLYWDKNKFVWSTFPLDFTLDQAKELLGNQISSSAHSKLVGSDWMVVRKVEEDIAVPAPMSEWRSEIRSLTSSKKTTLSAKTTKAKLNEFAQSEEFLSWPEEPTVV